MCLFSRSTDCAVNTERYRDKTVLAAAADQSRGSTIKVSVAGSGKQSSPGVEGTFRVARATTNVAARVADVSSSSTDDTRFVRSDRILEFSYECPSFVEGL